MGRLYLFAKPSANARYSRTTDGRSQRRSPPGEDAECGEAVCHALAALQAGIVVTVRRSLSRAPRGYSPI